MFQSKVKKSHIKSTAELDLLVKTYADLPFAVVTEPFSINHDRRFVIGDVVFSQNEHELYQYLSDISRTGCFRRIEAGSESYASLTFESDDPLLDTFEAQISIPKGAKIDGEIKQRLVEEAFNYSDFHCITFFNRNDAEEYINDSYKYEVERQLKSAQSFECLKAIIKSGGHALSFSELVLCAISVSHVDALKYLAGEGDLTDPKYLAHALLCTNIDVINWLLERGAIVSGVTQKINDEPTLISNLFSNQFLSAKTANHSIQALAAHAPEIYSNNDMYYNLLNECAEAANVAFFASLLNLREEEFGSPQIEAIERLIDNSREQFGDTVDTIIDSLKHNIAGIAPHYQFSKLIQYPQNATS